jgi:hypothetical protein
MNFSANPGNMRMSHPLVLPSLPNHFMRSDIDPAPTLDPSLTERLTRFAKSPQTGVWNHLDKHQIVSDIRARLADPFQVQQGGNPFCAPAAVVFELIRKQPHRYIDICQSLYEHGSFDGFTKKIAAAGRLCRSYGNLRMAQADWMLLATLRDCANFLVPVNPRSPKIVREFSGITKPWEMSSWVRELLGYQTTKSYPTPLWNEFRALGEANNIINGGGVAFALINSNGLLGNNSFIVSRFHRIFPNHWVPILGNISIEPTTQSSKKNRIRVNFDIYSWGKKIRVNADTAAIKDYFWGVTIGK